MHTAEPTEKKTWLMKTWLN